MTNTIAPGQREAYKHDQHTTAVPVSNSDRFFLIDTDVWDRRAELGIAPPFFLHGNGRKGSQPYVRFRTRDLFSKVVTLSRVITNAGPGRVAQHRNGNLLDCRKANLVVR